MGLCPFVAGMDEDTAHATLLRAVAAKARRLLSDSSDPQTRELLTQYAEKCDLAADRLNGALSSSVSTLH